MLKYSFIILKSWNVNFTLKNTIVVKHLDFFTFESKSICMITVNVASICIENLFNIL